VASDRSGLSNIGIKVSFYLGRAYSCQSLTGLADRWSEAEKSTISVIEAYEKGNDRVKVQASEAHANLGLIYWARPIQDEQIKTSNLQKAAVEYLKAIELAKWPDRQGVFYRYLAELYEALHEYDKADEAWQQAIRLEKHETPAYPDLQQQFLKERQATPTVN
jgi:tetratricopeptide (TPR) repeat protein